MKNRTVELGDICEFLDHERKPVSEELRKSGPYPYYGANGQQGWIDDFIFDEPLVLLAEDGGHFGSTTNPIAYKVTGKTWVNNHAHVLRPLPDCDVDYLTHVLSFYDVSKIVSGTTRPKLTKGNAELIRIPLPSLAEQQRVAEQLEQADRLRRTRRYALELSDTFLPAAFLQLFGKDAGGFPVSTVEDLLVEKPNAIRTGPFGSQLLHSEFTDSGIAVLGIDNAVNNKFEWAERRFITPQKYQQLRRYTVFPGDVIITLMGTCGRCAIVPDDIPTAINTKHLCCITLNQKRCLPVYLQGAFLHHPFVRDQLGVATKGAIMQGLNMGIIQGLRIPVSPLPLQEQFAALVAWHERLRAVQRESLRQAEHLFQSLLHRAFSH